MNPQSKSKRHWLYIMLGAAGLFLLSPQLKAHVKKIERDVSPKNNGSLKPIKPLQGQSLFKAQCAMCHSLTSAQIKAAPAMSEVVSVYQGAYGDAAKSKFITFAQNPHMQTPLIGDAVDRFGKMPKMGYNQTDLEKIADYLWSSL